MALRISIEWQRPVELLDGSNQNMIYMMEDDDDIPGEPGIYVFARKYGRSMVPLYVGQARNLRTRVLQHLWGNVPLMKGIENAPSGSRHVLIGVCRTKPGQQLAKVLDVLERAYIDSALTAECDLLNKQGTKTPVHHIVSSGPKKAHAPFPRRMNAKAH